MLFSILWIILGIVLVGFLVVHFKYPEKKSEIEKKLGEWLQFIFPIDWDTSLEDMEKNHLKALMDMPTISKMLLLRAYRKLSSNGLGIYELASGRKGIGFEIECPTYLTDDVTSQVRRAFLDIGIEDLVVQVVTYASDNVDDFIKRAKKTSQLEDINIDNPRELEIIGTEMLEKINTWSKKSMHRDGYAIFKSRNFINMIIVIFPSHIKDRKIASVANEVKGKLEMAGLSPIYLSAKRVIEVYSEILKEGGIKGIDYDPFIEMNVQLTRGAKIRISQDNGIVRIGDGTYAKVFSTRQFPKHTNSMNVANAFFSIEGGLENPLPSKFLITTTIHIENQEVLKENILKKARMNIMHGGDSEKMKKSTIVADTIRESEMIVNMIERENEKPYNGMWTLTIFENSIEELENRTGKIKSAFEKIDTGGWYIEEEKFGGIANLCMLYSLPFQFDLQAKQHLNRYNLLFSSNIQAILPLMGAFKGFAKPVIKFFGRTGQCVGIDLWSSATNYNCCIVGNSGTGKSFLSNTIQASNLMAGVRTFIVDKGNSYLGFCSAIGGEYITFGADVATGEEKKVCLNFFTNVGTIKMSESEFLEGKLFFGKVNLNISEIVDENGKVEIISKEEMEQITSVVSIMAGIKNTHEEQQKHLMMILENAVNIAFFRKGRQAGMKEVLKAIEEQKKLFDEYGEKDFSDELVRIIEGLGNYGQEGGRYFEYFNGAYNLDSTKDFIVLECDDLISKGQEIYNVVIMSAIIRNSQEMFADKEGLTKRIIVVDEATPLLRDVRIAKFLDDLVRRVRKHNGSVMIITQKIDDFNANDFARGVWSNSDHKFCLQMDSAEVERAFSGDGLLMGMNDFIKRQMKTIRNNKPHYSEVLYFYGNSAFPLQLKVSGVGYAMFTSDAKDKGKMKEFKKKYSLSLEEARLMFGYTMDGLSEEKAFQKIKNSGNKENGTIYWLNNIRNALKKHSFAGTFDVFIDREKNPLFIRSEALIVLEGGDEYKVTDFEDIASENGYIPSIFEEFLNFILSKNIKNTALKIPKALIGEGIVSTIKEKRNKRFSYSLCISYQDCKNKNVRDLAIKFSKKAQEEGFGVILEEIDFFNADLELINQIKPTYMLPIGSMNNDMKKEKIFIEMFENEILFANRNTQNMQDFERQEKMGYRAFCGNYVDRVLSEEGA